VHSACIENPRETSVSRIRRPRRRQRRDLGIPAPIHPFPRKPARRNSRDICLPTISFSLSLSIFFKIPHEHRRLTPASLYFSIRPFFSFIQPRLQPETVPVVWTTARILFRRLRATFPIENLSPLSPRSWQFISRLYIFFLFVYIYIHTHKYTTTHDEWFLNFSEQDTFACRRFHSAVLSSALFSNELREIFLCRNSARELGNAKRHVSQKYTECRSITICENAL